jgi:hypothetical protein
VQQYFFDLHWGEQFMVDDEGVGHFDEGSALYYGRTIADRIARDRAFSALEVHILSSERKLLAVVSALAGHAPATPARRMPPVRR